LLGHPNSISTAEAAYCAGEQNRFWEFHDIIFANQSTLFMNVNQKLDKTFNAYANALGMDLESFESCMKSDKYMAEIQQDYLEAQQAGVNSTPSFLINDVLVVGNQPLSEFQAIIEAELAQAGQ
jgi:protein-disulfide isomerase